MCLVKVFKFQSIGSDPKASNRRSNVYQTVLVKEVWKVNIEVGWKAECLHSTVRRKSGHNWYYWYLWTQLL